MCEALKVRLAGSLSPKELLNIFQMVSELLNHSYHKTLIRCSPKSSSKSNTRSSASQRPPVQTALSTRT